MHSGTEQERGARVELPGPPAESARPKGVLGTSECGGAASAHLGAAHPTGGPTDRKPPAGHHMTPPGAARAAATRRHATPRLDRAPHPRQRHLQSRRAFRSWARGSHAGAAPPPQNAARSSRTAPVAAQATRTRPLPSTPRWAPTLCPRRCCRRSCTARWRPAASEARRSAARDSRERRGDPLPQTLRASARCGARCVLHARAASICTATRMPARPSAASRLRCWLSHRRSAAPDGAGMVADGFTYPVCTIKNRMQARHEHATRHAARARAWAALTPRRGVARARRRAERAPAHTPTAARSTR